MNDDRLILGIDAGTTRIRALVFTLDGRVVAEGSRPTEVERPRPGWAEHDAEALWRAACGALSDATAKIERPVRISGVAVASVGEAFIALDRDGRPTCPSSPGTTSGRLLSSPASRPRSARTDCTR